MGRATSEKVGRGVCPDFSCGEPVVYRKSAGGMLTHRCENCDSTGYCEPGGLAYASRMATIKGATPAPAKITEPEPKPLPAKRGGFNLADL